MKKIFSLIIIVHMIAACGSEKKEDATTTAPQAIATNDKTVTLTEAQYKTAGIQAQVLSNSSVAHEIVANGFVSVSPESVVSVSSPLGGFLKQSNIIIGTFVQRGQMIAVLEDEQYIQLQQDYLLTKANIQYTAQDLERQRALNATKAVSDKQYQQALRDYQMDKIKLQSLAAKLKLININAASLTENNISNTARIYAPISGYVSKINFTLGSYVTPSVPVYEIVNNNNIYITAKLFERDINNVSIGQQVVAYRNEQPDKKYFCTIRSIEQEVNEDRTIDVIAAISNPDGVLKNGMYVNVNITTSSTSGTSLPLDAVVNHEGRDWVFVERGTRQYEMMPVTILSRDTKQAIIQDMPELSNKPVVTANAYTLLMALKNVEEE